MNQAILSYISKYFSYVLLSDIADRLIIKETRRFLLVRSQQLPSAILHRWAGRSRPTNQLLCISQVRQKFVRCTTRRAVTSVVNFHQHFTGDFQCRRNLLDDSAAENASKARVRGALVCKLHLSPWFRSMIAPDPSSIVPRSAASILLVRRITSPSGRPMDGLSFVINTVNIAENDCGCDLSIPCIVQAVSTLPVRCQQRRRRCPERSRGS